MTTVKLFVAVAALRSHRSGCRDGGRSANSLSVEGFQSSDAGRALAITRAKEKDMRKYAVALATLGIAVVGFAGPAQAGERTGRTPGQPSCFGQEARSGAQHGQKTLRPEGYTGRINGIAGYARGVSIEAERDVSVRELVAWAKAECSE